MRATENASSNSPTHPAEVQLVDWGRSEASGMRKTSLLTGPCVFCEYRQIWRSLLPVTTRRSYEKLARAERPVVRRIADAKPTRERGSSRQSENLFSKKFVNDGDLRRRIQDPRAKHDAYNRGFVKLSALQKDGKEGRETAAGKRKTFREALGERLEVVEQSIHKWEALNNLELSDEERTATFSAFKEHVLKVVASYRVRQQLQSRDKTENDEGAKLANDLLQAFQSRGIATLDTILKYGYYGHVASSKFSTLDLRNQRNLADLRYPLEWYPKTRTKKRKIHLHVGPTNSGKTYHALKALEVANRGIYAGPLRLLAHEVFTRLNAAGRRCQLVTGEERRFPDDDPTSELVSCTVEMVDCSSDMDVAVIDEIQMIGSDERGWAWTQALLGVQAKEVHLCGEERTVPLIKELAAMMGDTLEIHRYERLTPLEMDSHHLNGNLKHLRKGDCIVAFSVLGIHALKRSIERQTNKKVAIVYGSLPPETRAQQAKLFNDPDNDYDFLVASDAVGMGLNLSIKRVIFEASQKNDGVGLRTLKVSEIKQIAGRAGRFRTAHQAIKQAEEHVRGQAGEDVTSTLDASPPQIAPSIEVVHIDNKTEAIAEDGKESPVRESSSEALLSSDSVEGEGAAPNYNFTMATTYKNRQENTSNAGFVTTLYPFDYPIIAHAMTLEPEPIKSAGLHPPPSVIERFTSYFPPGTPFSYILLRLNEISQMSTRFHLCGLKDSLLVADAIHPIEGLTTTDRIIMCAAPISLNRDPNMKGFIQQLARAIANQQGGSLLDIPAVDLPLERIDLPVSGGRKYLEEMEKLHKMIITYLWLSYRFSGVFSTRQLAFYVKELIEKRIDTALSKFNFSERSRQKIRQAREKSLLEELENAASSDMPGGETVEDDRAGVAARGNDDDETADSLDELDEDDGESDLRGESSQANTSSHVDASAAVGHEQVRPVHKQAELNAASEESRE